MSDIFVEIIRTRGSTPRDTGTSMRVSGTETQGTIGGGALEHQAIAAARELLATDHIEITKTIPLGPGLGQCCGGAVTLRFSREVRPTDIDLDRALFPFDSRAHEPAPLWIWGAGHVGRAVAKACPPDAFDLTWVDSAADRFPSRVPAHVTATPATDMPRLAAHAPPDAHHLIFTYSHDIDLALCAALLRQRTASIGLIGSKTKWARFRNRLSAIGLDPSPIICPIGDTSLGKEPHNIAHGVVTELFTLIPSKAFA
jgi:xanthine dehydrogenase accessory factor